MLKLLLVLTVAFQSIATVYALRLVRTTRYNAIWILFIVGFTLLSFERLMQLSLLEHIEKRSDIWLGIVVSICLSIGVMYAHKLFKYIDKLDRQRQRLEKRILTAVLRTEERSRGRFAKELHDGLGPLLSSAKMSLTALSRDDFSEDQRELLQNSTYVIEEAIASLREISNNLSPHVLNDFGLGRGVKNYVDRTKVLHSVKIDFETNLRAERFDSDVEVIFYRVICELINNSLKHSKCKQIKADLIYRDNMLVLDYCDDGCGFDPDALIDCGMGLSNISSRIRSLNGRLKIESDNGHGMTARIEVAIHSGTHISSCAE